MLEYFAEAMVAWAILVQPKESETKVMFGKLNLEQTIEFRNIRYPA
jgi:hypothetical protein